MYHSEANRCTHVVNLLGGGVAVNGDRRRDNNAVRGSK